MDARDLLRSFRMAGSASGRLAARSAWRRRRTDTRDLVRHGPERARVPGAALDADPQAGGGTVRFTRSSLRIRVAVGGAVFCGWDGAGPEPSYALAGGGAGGGGCPAADTRAVLEPDKDGWRVVSERMTVLVSRQGTVEIRTPGGLLLRRELPPRWWDPVGRTESAGRRWVQRSETPADARVYGLGGRAAGPRLPAGGYRLWNTDPGGSFGPGDDPLYITMPVQLVVADAGCHLIFHDSTWDGQVTLRDGEEGAGSGHDRPGGCEVRMDGGPLRYWVIAGTPARILAGWTALTGRPALPPRWALGHQHSRWGFGSEQEVRRVAAGYREHGLPLSVLHLDIDHLDGNRVFTVDRRRFPDLPGMAAELAGQGVRLVSIVDPAVKAEPGVAAYDGGIAADAFVRDARGGRVRGVVWPGEAVFPDFTDPAARSWWGGLYAERLAQGFAGVWHDMNEPVSFAAFGDATLPRSARHVLEGRGGDHREAHNVYGLAMARAGYEGLRRLRPEQRPFLFSRSGWVGMQRYGGTWSGDVATGWEGLRASLALVLGLGLCGVPYSGPDVGGFTGTPSPELYLRWFQLGAYLPFFRTHSAIGAGRREPWEFGPEVLAHAREALAGRMRLLPYLETLSHIARGTGAPYVRPLWWGSPGDRALRECGDAFLLGDALLVAPVLEPGAVSRTVRLPRGRWYDTVTGAVHRGRGQVVLDAPPDRIPVLARAGSVLPVAGADGAVELEAWAPRQGRTGSGVVFTGDPEGWDAPRMERFVSRWVDGEVVVERDGGGEPGYRVRVRGAAS
ncbi:alpha-glucosidase [Streptomyces sp. DvalAA-14]|uniref:glycoside hydrolase family 31 protein n=1 Tax=unclassified Streptomyces TaxID=2593676 RepID=UPI00081B56E0|nr:MULTISPECIES: glycoside hydrolase family 31 protein [unclassified Streptomyces]MYS23130.1 glycosyl hydrolase [Streptomyces sp. SID4948]SCE28007.1 alpha-glucosidase [Streptomyces sp. DvalAA-14]